MTAVAEIIGWFMIALFAACTPLIVLGLKERRQSKREAELEEKRLDEQFPPLRRSQFAPYVPQQPCRPELDVKGERDTPQWQAAASDLDDPNLRSTPPPSDPAS